jgi:hypothetical protein
MVRDGLADGPRARRSLRVLHVLARLRFRSVVFLCFDCARFRTVRVCRADSPRVHGGQSACSPRTVRFSELATGGSVAFNGQSAAQVGRYAVPVRTTRGALADSPPLLVGRSARAWLLCFLARFLPPSFVLPRVLQGIVPKT